MRAKEFLSELFDPKLAMPLQWEVDSNVVYAYGQVKTKHGDVSIDLTFAKMDKGSWNIEFMVGGSFEMTGGGGSSQVFATVIAGVKKFLTKVSDVDTITFTAEEKSRAKMYDTLAKRVARDIGWHVVPFDDMQNDPKYGLLRSHGAFAFAIEKGQAPEHRQAAQKPQHGHWITTFYIYSREDETLPIIKVKAKSGLDAENHVIKTVPEYKGADPMGVFATREPIPDARDIGSVPPPQPKPAPRVLTPLEQKLKDKLGEADFGGQDVQGNVYTQFKDKFPNLSTVLYFIPGLAPALMAADAASAVQMYNQAIAKIEQKYPEQTIKTAQQQAGDAGEEWVSVNESRIR